MSSISGREETPKPRRAGDFRIVAHRAGAKRAPENTLAALEQAIADGADMAELDLRMTRDGVVVALHDESLGRTTGLSCDVWDADLRVVRQLDAGSWYGEEFRGERVPTLAEVVEAARGRICLMLEMKQGGRDREAAEAAVRLLKEAGLPGEYVLASMDLDLLKLSKELAPELLTFYIGDGFPLEFQTLEYVDGYSIQLSGLDEENVSLAHSAGKPVYTWTVNREAEMERAFALGVDGLVSDDPELAASWYGLKRAQQGME